MEAGASLVGFWGSAAGASAWEDASVEAVASLVGVGVWVSADNVSAGASVEAAV